jgi:hypothetical protein
MVPQQIQHELQRILKNQEIEYFLEKLMGIRQVKRLLPEAVLSGSRPAACMSVPCLAGANRWAEDGQSPPSARQRFWRTKSRQKADKKL